MYCRNCGTEAATDERYCRTCGQALGAAVPATRFEWRRLGMGDLICFAGTAAVFTSLFLPWYRLGLGGLNGLGSTSASITISALSPYAGEWRFLIFALCLVIAAYLVLRTFVGGGLILPRPHWQVLTTVAVVQLVLVLLASHAKPGLGGASFNGLSITWAYGVWVAIVGAAFACLGALARAWDPETLPRPAVSAEAERPAATAPTAFPFDDLSIEPTGPPTMAATCPACGHELRPGNQFCTWCGSASTTAGRSTP